MQQHALDRLFVALSDPGRRHMVEQLSSGPATVKELAEPVGMRLPSAVKHLKVLEEGGIVVSQKRGRQRTYTMNPDAFKTLDAWLQQRKSAMHDAFDRLAAAMAELPEKDLDA